MRIEGDRVGAFGSRHHLAAPLGQEKESAVGAVHVEPEPLPGGDVRERGEVVHRAGVDAAGVADDEERLEAGRPVGRDRARQLLHADPEEIVRRDLPDVPLRKSREHRGLLDGVVELVRGVDRPREEVLGQSLAPRCDDRREVRERPSRRQDAARRFGIAGDPAEPGHDVRLDLRQARRGGEDADVAVRRSRDQVGDRRVRDTSARDIGG